jgi:hypothetical protein
VGQTCCPTEPIPIHRITRSAILVVAISLSLAPAVTSPILGATGHGLRAVRAAAHEGDTFRDKLIHVNTSTAVSECELRSFPM